MAKSSFFSGTGTTPTNVESVASSKAAAEASENAAAASAAAAAQSATQAETSNTDSNTAKVAAQAAQAAAETAETNSAASAASAATSLAGIGNSETNAATSASESAASAAAAAASASSASSSATSAAADAASAATSLSNIGSAEANAAASATSAASSASSASTDAASASASQVAAAASEAAAATSEANSATSETNAATSASQSATSAANSATSETNAATSASSASTSASNAASSASAASASQVAAAASAASAANAYDTFDDRYLGSKTADPTVDNDGNALVQGSLYFNSTANEMRVYDGGSWIAASSAGGASLLEYKYTATAAQTTFSGADDNANTLSYTQDNLIVTLNGVVLENGADYTATTGTSVVLASGAAASDELNVIAFKSFTTADMVSSANGGTFYNSIAITGDLTVDTNTLYVDSTNNRIGVGTSSPSSYYANQLVVDTGSALQSGITIVSDTGNQGMFAFADGTSGDQRYRGFLDYNHSNDVLSFGTAGGERMRIDSSGRLLLGTTTAGESSADDLTIATTGQTGITLRSGTANAGAIYFADGTSGTAQYSGYIYYGHSNNALGFATNATERMRIDSSGNVGIGTSSPLVPLHVSTSGTSTASGGNAAVSIRSEASGRSSTLQFSDGATSTWIGQVSGSNINFGTNSSERMRIDSSGRVTKPNQPVFSYLGSHSYSIATTGTQTMSSSNVWAASVNHALNRGSHFNPSTGRFTAPVAGTYHFQFTCTASDFNSGYLWFYMSKNGSAKSYVQASQQTEHTMIVHNFYFDLSANDYVSVQWTNNYVSGKINYPGFSGYLVG